MRKREQIRTLSFRTVSFLSTALALHAEPRGIADLALVRGHNCYLANVENVVVRSQNHELRTTDHNWCCTLSKHGAGQAVGLVGNGRCLLGRQLQNR